MMLNGNNTIVINGNEVKILDADCKDELCIKQGSISIVVELKKVRK